jgi:hypothetical protein
MVWLDFLREGILQCCGTHWLYEHPLHPLVFL